MTTEWSTPDWVKHAVFYQIFPERYANGERQNDPENAQPWGTAPTLHNLMGGDLQGIIDHLDDLEALGVTALYLNPIFQATTSHKYNTYDYFKIDPHFGTLETFHTLVAELHKRDMKLILDAVFNHCGRGFFAFHDIIENGPHSPYLDWFHITKFPIHPYEGRFPANYQTWWDFRELPKFNTDNQSVRKYLLDVARYWIEQGADGWRLDVPNEIADHNFWREFRDVVKDANPEAYIVGEIWKDGSPWLQGDQFDAVMNYLFRDLCTDFFAENKIKADEFGSGIDRLITLYDPQITYVQFNLLGSHDTARYLTVAKKAGGFAHERIKLAYHMLMCFPGAPCVYYGDEVGVEGENDPDCRRCFPWDEQDSWDTDLYTTIQTAIKVRHDHNVLRTGHFSTLLADNATNIYSCARWNDDEQLLLVFNNSDTAWTFDLPLSEAFTAPAEYYDLANGDGYMVNNDKVEGIHLQPWAFMILRHQH